MARSREVAPLARADLVTAAALLVFAVTVIVEALRMPRFAETGGDPFTAPGIVPGFYAVVIGILAAALAARSIAGGALRRGPAAPDPEAVPASRKRLAIAAALILFFIVGLVGHVPFWLAAFVFVALFIAVFEWRPGLGAGARLRAVGAALVIAAATAAAVTYVFQELFLVRLP